MGAPLNVRPLVVRDNAARAGRDTHVLFLAPNIWAGSSTSSSVLTQRCRVEDAGLGGGLQAGGRTAGWGEDGGLLPAWEEPLPACLNAARSPSLLSDEQVRRPEHVHGHMWTEASPL